MIIKRSQSDTTRDSIHDRRSANDFLDANKEKFKDWIKLKPQN